MDNIDYQILSLLQQNAKITNSEIARQIGMVPSGVLERIRKLEENGYIDEYTTRLNAELLELGLLAFVFARSNDPPGHIEIAEKLTEIPEVQEVHHVAGEDCYLLKVRLKDNLSLAKFLKEKIGTIAGISSTRSVIVLETLKETSQIFLAEPEGDQDWE